MGSPSTPSYRDSGVDMEAGQRFVRSLVPLAQATSRPGVHGALGGFGGLFDLHATGYKDPLLVAATDGVGTKIDLAIQANHHERIGMDLVAMCVNDVVVQGAEPLFFLDYLATRTLQEEEALRVMAGIAQGCREAGCALIGGETAEMPSKTGSYDLAGFAVGAVEREALLPRKTQTGDILIGLASSGLHANGFSLVRRLMEKERLSWESPFPGDARQTLGEILTTPTRIYVRSLLKLLRHEDIHITTHVKALAHITGGGLVENIPRVLSPHLTAEISLPPLPQVMCWIRDAAGLSQEELVRIFNCGIGMVLVVAPEGAPQILSALEESGERAYEIGQLSRAQGGVQIMNSP